MRVGEYARYAVYWAPEQGSALWQAGASWLGWDAAAGRAVARPEEVLPDGLNADALTATPRRYGFHATLKPPFRLADGTDAGALDAALAALAARTAPAEGAPLTVDARLGFVALRPSGASPAVDAVAAACVKELDRFRAPPDAAELAKRRAGGLSPAQDENLVRWGYPYVLGEFRFHLTLTGRLADPEPVRAALARHFAPHLEGPLVVARLCLFGDPGGGAPFRLLRAHALTG